MDGERFDQLAKTLASSTTRRRLLGGLLGGALTGLGFGSAAARGTCPRDEPIRCGTDCVDLRANPNHCGRCGRECAPGQVCYAGRCGSCPNGFAACNSTCVRACAGDLQPDPSQGCACGCPDPALPIQSDNRCLPPDPCATDAECDDGITCTANQCQSGTCVASPNDALCDDGNVCTVGVCDPSQGGCVVAPVADGTSCDAGAACCGGSCVDFTSDPANCGDCGNPCGSEEICTAGACVVLTCADTCAGCCDGATCIPEPDSNLCGQDGGVCENCAATDQVCCNGRCAPCCGATLCDESLSDIEVCDLLVLPDMNCELEYVTILGNLGVAENGSLEVRDSTIHGSVHAANHDGISISWSTINGSVTMIGGSQSGSGSGLLGAEVGGDIIISGNGGWYVYAEWVTTPGSITINENTSSGIGGNYVIAAENNVGGNLLYTNNTGENTWIFNNTITGELACSGNVPDPTNFDEENIAGSKSGQCEFL